MGLTRHIRGIKPKSLKQMTLPLITKGETSVQSETAMDEGFSPELLNCRYVGGNLQVGRGGLTELTSTALNGSIISIVKASVAGAEHIYIATPTTVYRYTTTFSAVVTGLTGITQLIPFNKDLIICCSGRARRWDGTHLFVIGSNKDNITGVPRASSGTVYTGNTLSENWTTANDGAYRRVTQVKALMLKSGSPTGSITCTVNSVASSAVDITVGVGAIDSYVDFEFPTPVDVAPNTTVAVVFSMTAGDASNYCDVALDATADVVMAFNGVYAPEPEFGYVHNGRLILSGDDSVKERVYFTNVNAPDDFYSSYGGYVSFLDSTSSVVTGVDGVFGQLFITGKAFGRYQSTLLDENFDISKVFNGGGISPKAIVGSPNTLLFVNDNGLSLTSGSDSFGDLTFNLASTYVADKFADNADSSTICRYIAKDKQAWVLMDGSADVMVLHIEGGQWTRYRFTDITPTDFTEIEGDGYLGSTDGKVYQLDYDISTDAGAAIEYSVKTQQFSFANDRFLFLKQVLWNLESLPAFYAKLDILTTHNSLTFEISKTSQAVKIVNATWNIYNSKFSIAASYRSPLIRCHIDVDAVRFHLYDITPTTMPMRVSEINLGLIRSGVEK